MSIRRSAAPEIQLLVDALSSADDVKRESAIARLAIIGGRAMDRLSAAYGSADRDTRIAILQAAEAIADPRGIPLATQALAEGGDLARAGTLVLRALLDSPVNTAAAAALDVLIATALDGSAERAVRRAAFDALQDMPARVRDRVAEALRDDPDLDVRAHAADAPRGAAAAEAVWKDALEGALPEDPTVFGEAVRHRAAAAPLSALQKLVDFVRERESAVSSQPRREAWRQIRGLIHQSLALRGSRVAVYDLRETVASDASVPSSFLTALHVVGDESCLEPLAAAWNAAEADAHLRQQLESAFNAIVAREKISPRSPTLKRIAVRYPDGAFSTLSRTTPRRSTRRRT